jgi:hypothetical protein
MKKIFFPLFAFFLLSSALCAQSLGVGVYALGFFPKPVDAIDQTIYSDPREMGHMPSFSPGIRGELNIMQVGMSPAKIGYLGLGVSYFFPHSDSAYYIAQLKTGHGVKILGTQKTTALDISMRIAYDIPQSFNDFLSLHLGLGIGMLRYTTTLELPEKSSTFNYEKSDFEEESFVTYPSGDVHLEVLAGGMYEFEKFYIVGQYSLIIGMDRQFGRGNRHGITAGIYYPIKRFGE